MTLRTEIEIVIHDLFTAYDSAEDSPAERKKRLPIVERLQQQFDRQEKVNALRDGESGARAKPGPRPPGAMEACYAIDDIEQVIRGWYLFLVAEYPVLHDRKTHRGRVEIRRQAMNMLDYADREDEAHLFADFRAARRAALVTLGLARPLRALRGVACPACGKAKLVFDPMVDWGEIACTHAGPAGCHDDRQFPSCRREGGSLTCRRSARSARHGLRYTVEDLAQLAEA